MLSSLVTSHSSTKQRSDLDGWEINCESSSALDGLRTPAITLWPRSRSCFTNSKPIPLEAPTTAHVSAILGTIGSNFGSEIEWEAQTVSYIEEYGRYETVRESEAIEIGAGIHVVQGRMGNPRSPIGRRMFIQKGQAFWSIQDKRNHVTTAILPLLYLSLYKVSNSSLLNCSFFYEHRRSKVLVPSEHYPWVVMPLFGCTLKAAMATGQPIHSFKNDHNIFEVLETTMSISLNAIAASLFF